jgi:hypothetical protein
MCAAFGPNGNFSTLLRASIGDASDLTLIVASRFGSGAKRRLLRFFASSLSAFAKPFAKAAFALLSHCPNGPNGY